MMRKDLSLDKFLTEHQNQKYEHKDKQKRKNNNFATADLLLTQPSAYNKFYFSNQNMQNSKYLIALLLVQLSSCAVIMNQSPALSNNYYEALYRNYIIETNRQRIQSSNQQSLTFRLEVNKFVQLSQTEFQNLFLVTRVSDKAEVVSPFRLQPANNNTVSVSSNSIFNNALFYSITTNDYVDIDWTRSGMVTSVKNQGGCGSCWAFSAVSDLESSYLLNGFRGNLDLSEQQLVDCSSNFYNFGCGGGWMTNAFAYMYRNPITTETDYPYVGTVNTCKNVTGTFSLKNLRSYWQNKNCQLLVDILQTRPLSVAVAADSFYWGFYKSGVLNQCSTSINHGVSLVGVKKSATQNYWLVKNSWGADWGESGYVKIDRSQNNGNLCDICSYPQYSMV